MTNVMQRALIIAKAECYVRGHGTVAGPVVPKPLRSGSASEERFVFPFSRALNTPAGCTMKLWDQFGKQHKVRVRLQHGNPMDPY